MARRSDLLEFAVLGLLHDGPTHGYDLRRRLNSALGPFRALSYGTLYPALRSLVERGLITHSVSAEVVPPTASTRARIVYELTADGKERFNDLLATAGSDAYDDDGFDVRFHFFARTAADVRLRILEGRRSRLEENLTRFRENAARNRERLDNYTSALAMHGEETTEREVRWLTELIDAERRHPTDPGPMP